MKLNILGITLVTIVLGAAGWRTYDILKRPSVGNSRDASGVSDVSDSEMGGPSSDDIFKVVTAKVELRDVTECLRLRGVIAPEKEASVGSVIGGKLERLLKLEGEHVRSGELVARLDPSVLQLEKLKAQAAVARAEVSCENEKKSLQRKRNLLGKNVVSEKDVLDEEVECANAVAELEQVRAELKVIESKLGYCKIVAPFDGFLSERFQNEGDYIQPEGAIFTIIKIDKVFAACDVLETDYGKIRLNQQALVEVLAYPTERFNGAVRRISPNVNNATRVGRIWIEIENSSHRLRPGMFAAARVKIAVRESSIVVPQRSVLEKQGRNIVFIKSDGRYHPVEVKTGLTIPGDRIEIIEGLSPDDEIVVEGNYELAYSDIADLIILED